MKMLLVLQNLLILIIVSALSKSKAETTTGILTTSSPRTGITAVRLVDGDFCSGRVEVLINGIWGTVCDDGWDLSDAAVVCREVSCGNVVEAKIGAFFGEGLGQIWLENVQCIGNESSLANCSSSGWRYCAHSEDAGVICQDIAIAETTTPPLTNGVQTTSKPWKAPEIFYPFGSAAGDTETFVNGDESFASVGLSSPFTYFGRRYNQIHVNNNGLLTFNQPVPEADPPYPFPTSRNEDFIAPLWGDFDDYGLGMFSYQQYTNGSVLTRATQDINQYFPDLNFTATWVFVATWDFVETWDLATYNSHSGPAISVQAVLITGDGLSFILMNYGDIGVTPFQVQAGYDTVGSTDYFLIPESNDESYIPNLKNTSNVHVPGRWAFRVNSVSKVIGVEVRLTSFSDLTVNENIQIVLEDLKQELISRGLPNTIEMKMRRVQETKP